MTRALVLIVTLLLAAAPAAAVTTWHSVPLWGGDVRSLAFAPEDPDVVLAGTANGQVYLSRDAGGNWSHAGQMFPLPGWLIAGLQFDPNKPTRVWGALRGVFGGGAVVRSDDLGKTWELRTMRPDDEVFALALVPGEDGRLFIGTRSGVWGSTDEGAHWKHLSKAQPDLVEVSSLLVPPQSPQTVIAGTFRRAFRSDDGGVTWRGVFDGMVLDTEIFSLAAAPQNAGEVWAATCGWVYKSADNGEHWERHKDGLTERRAPGIQVLPNGRLLVGTVAGLFTSDDGGKTWKRETRDDLSVLSVAYHPRHPEVVLAGTEGSGVWRSTDGGNTFMPSSRGIASARVTALVLDGADMLAAVAHAGPARGIYGVPADGRRAQQLVSDVPTVLALAVSGRDAWAATEAGLFARRDGVWERVQELPASRFEQVAAAGEGRVTARSLDGLWKLDGAKFVLVSSPPAGADATLAALAAEGSDSTRKLVERLGARGRVVPTGNAAYPAVVVGSDAAQLAVAATGTLRPLPLPMAARDVVAAAVDGGNLFLGTAGFGIVYAPLAELAPGEAAPKSGVAGTAPR